MDEADRELSRAETQANEYLEQISSSEVEAETQPINTRPDLSRHPTHVHRLESQAIHHTHTVSAASLSAKRLEAIESRPLPVFGAGKSYPPEVPAERAAYVVDFAGPDDPLHPQNWPRQKKLVNLAIGAYASLSVSVASSMMASATGKISKEYHVSVEVASLLSVTYLLGYVFGSSIWAPLSELRGRKLPLVIGTFGFAVFAVAVAVAKDIQTIIICRFFEGLFGGCPLVVVAGMLIDQFHAEVRGLALVVFASSVFVGPLVGPIIGNFTVTSYLSWRWCSYWSMIMGFVALFLVVFFLHETYAPILLVQKAGYLRRRTKNWAIHAKQEEIEIDIKELVSKNITRPLRLFAEPIVLLTSVYVTFVYTLLYVSISAYPAVFEGKHHFKPGPAALPFIGMIIGVLILCAAFAYDNKRWVRKYHASGNRFEPEWRLPLTAIAGVVFTIGLFWFGWSGNYPSVHWIVPTIAGAFIGFGILGVFTGLIVYLLDTYLMFAASALASNTIARSAVAASAPLYDRQLFQNVGVEWGMTLLACLALIMTPVPILFMKYGAKLREKSKWAPYKPLTPPAPSSETSTIVGSDSAGEGKKETDTAA